MMKGQIKGHKNVQNVMRYTRGQKAATKSHAILKFVEAAPNFAMFVGKFGKDTATMVNAAKDTKILL